MLDVLFGSSRVCLITFDAEGTIVGVNPHTAAFDGRLESPYRGVGLLSNVLIRRAGWAEPIKRVLAGETIELTDSRWVTLFSREERYVDVIAGPIIVKGKVIGGIAYLVDSTTKHRAEVVDSVNRKRARELEVFLARDVAGLIGALEGWSRSQPPSNSDTSLALATIEELSTVLDDLLHFIQLGTYHPSIERVLLADAARGLPAVADMDGIAVMADRRLLRRILRNLADFSARRAGGRWSVSSKDGRVVIEIPVEAPQKWLREILIANPASAAEADSAPDSLAAARWMAETLNGGLTVSTTRPSLTLNLPAADPQLACASDGP
jgi:hypothetical protein